MIGGPFHLRQPTCVRPPKGQRRNHRKISCQQDSRFRKHGIEPATAHHSPRRNSCLQDLPSHTSDSSSKPLRLKRAADRGACFLASRSSSDCRKAGQSPLWSLRDSWEFNTFFQALHTVIRFCGAPDAISVLGAPQQITLAGTARSSIAMLRREPEQERSFTTRSACPTGPLRVPSA
jgi:hypothetical protein